MEQTAQPSISVRKIAIAGVLAAITIFLGISRIGVIPVPNLSGNATINHIPAIIGGVLEGPLVGSLVGGIFGVIRFLQGDSPLIRNPFVAIIPRLLIGVTAYYSYAALKKWNEYAALAIAGIIGSVTNTVFFLGLAMLFQLFPATWVALAPVLPQATVEAILAAIINVAVVGAWKGIESNAGKGSKKV